MVNSLMVNSLMVNNLLLNGPVKKNTKETT